MKLCKDVNYINDHDLMLKIISNKKKFDIAEMILSFLKVLATSVCTERCLVLDAGKGQGVFGRLHQKMP
jgi:hypothetical protein